MIDPQARALQIAKEAHAGQLDKAGAPYVTHPIRVADQVDGEVARTVALLHDVVEDSDWTLVKLRAEGFSGNVIDAVDAMTHREGEEYFDAVRRAKANSIAWHVKLADLADNSARIRLRGMSKDVERMLARYDEARRILLDRE